VRLAKLKNNSKFLLVSTLIISISSPAFFIYLLNKAGVYLAPILVSIYFLLSMIFSVLFGRISDKIGKRKGLIIIGFLFTALLYLSIYFINDYILMILISALIGLAHSLWTPLCVAFFTHLEIQMASGRHASIINSMFSFGWAIGSILGGYIQQIYELNNVFIWLSIIAFFSLIPISFIKSDKIKSVNMINRGENGKIKIYKEYLDENNKRTSRNKNYFKAQHENYNSIIILLVICVSLRFLCSQGAVVGLLPNYLEYELKFTASVKGLILSVNMIMQCVFIIPLGYIIDKYGSKVILFLSILGSGLNSIFYSFLDEPIEIILNQFLIGFSYAGIISSTTAIIKDISDHRKFGQGMGINNTSRSIGGMIGPFMAYFMLSISYSFAFQVLGLFSIISSIIILIFLKENKKEHKYGIRFLKK